MSVFQAVFLMILFESFLLVCKVITFLILLTVVVGAAGAALGIAMMSSGSQVLHASGTKKIMIGLASIAGALCLCLGVTWIVQTVTGAGGGFTWQWPF